MSFQINGETWQPQTTSEHAANIINRINELLQENHITDADGNVVQLSASFANAFYLLALASGNRYADLDEKLDAAINSFNVALCDDDQIQNLLPIAGIDRNPGSYSTLELTATVAPGDTCTIPAGTRAPFQDKFFIVKDTVLIDNSTGEEPMERPVPTVCDTIGAVAVLRGEVSAFEGSITGLSSVTNNVSSIPGVNPETTNELRQRIIQGNTIKYTLDGCKQALEELTGVAYARVYFNYNTDSVMTLPGDIELAPRTAYIVVFGSGYDGLADTYSEYMSAPTQNAADAGDKAKSQNYVTQSGQEIPVYFDEAGEQIVHVKVFVTADAALDDQVENQIKRDLLLASANWEIGQNVTSLLCGTPLAAVTYTKVAYCQVSTDGETWQQRIGIGCNVIPRLTDASIEVEALEE